VEEEEEEVRSSRTLPEARWAARRAAQPPTVRQAQEG